MTKFRSLVMTVPVTAKSVPRLKLPTTRTRWPDSSLSLPAVAGGRDYVLSGPGTHPVASVAYRCQGEPVTVILLQRDNGT